MREELLFFFFLKEEVKTKIAQSPFNQHSNEFSSGFIYVTGGKSRYEIIQASNHRRAFTPIVLRLLPAISISVLVKVNRDLERKYEEIEKENTERAIRVNTCL